MLHETETDVQNVIADIKKDVQVADADLKAVSKWAAGMAPTVAVGLQSALSMLESIEAVTPSVGANADVKAAVDAAQLASTELTAFAASYNAGQNTAAAAVNGYVAVKQAQSAVASAAAAVAAAPTA